jgi:hypothetical protein
VGWVAGLRGRAALGGFLVGASPMLLDNVTAPAGTDSLSVFLRLNSGAGRGGLADQVHAAVIVGVPLAGGLCAPNRCGGWQAWWGPLYLLLLLAAAVPAVHAWRRVPREAAGDAQRVRYAGQLALAAVAVAGVVAYAHSPSAVAAPLESARYLSVLSVCLPAALWPAWLAASRLRGRITLPLRLAGAAVLAALTVTMVVATATMVARIPVITDRGSRERAVARTVERTGIRSAYGSYWTCYWLTFLTRERVVCAVLNNDLSPAPDRYPPYRQEVLRAAQPVYIFPADDPGDRAFRAYLRANRVEAVPTEVGGYRIYRPAATGG